MSKKILIFSYAYFPLVGGAEVAIKELTDRLIGFEFDMITYNIFGKEKDFEKIGNVNVYRLTLPTKFLFPVFSFLKAIRLNKGRKYDAMWSMMVNAGFAPLFLKYIFSNIKFILTLQEGDPIPQVKKRVWFVYPFFRMIFRKADYVTAISNYLADFAKDMGTRDVDVIPNGVDLEKWRIKTRFRSQGSFLLITTGRLVAKNAVDDVIRALEFLPKSVSLRSVGGGADEDSLRSLAKSLGLQKRVKFLPLVNHDALVRLFEDADAFIRPSLSEGLGNSFLEAMAVGLPIIGTKVGGIPDFLEDGQTGLFCRVRAPEDIAEKVKRLMDDQSLYARLSQNGLALIGSRYDWRNIAGDFERKILSKI
ncbi:MAG: glycosyltransferase family 4 protein [Candidatus Vogelbacteria bacterium]|nr:glycosyltransferase family 4 protein [Candidatus Vogelbacteria bacterium]